MKKGKLPYFGVCAGLAFIYFFAAWFGLKLAYLHSSATAVWPPSGIALAALLILGYRVWPGIFIGAFSINIFTNLSAHFAIGPSITSASVIAAGNTLEALLGALLLTRFARGVDSFSCTFDTFKFIFFAVLISPLVSATLGVTGLAAAGLASWQNYGAIWLTWWLGDALGILIVTPLALIWIEKTPRIWQGKQLAEGLGLIAILFLIAQYIFGGGSGDNNTYPMTFLPLPVLLWITYRFGSAGATLSTAVLSGVAVWGTIHGLGSFGMQDKNTALVMLQAFMGTIAVSTLVFASVISERKSVEERILEEKKNLERVNLELDNFVYIASHDLNAPVRNIATFAEILEKDYKKSLDDGGIEIVHDIKTAALRMVHLIQDLLTLSRNSRIKNPYEAVDILQLVRSVEKRLEQGIKQAGASFEIQADMPVVYCDRIKIAEVFVNLIQNALKFSAVDGKRPQIRAGCRSLEDRYEFFVEDNGIGIDAKYHKQIFEMFKRLHTSEEFEGTGAGLYIVRRILEDHGGEIWVRSKPSEGSTFYFTIPKSLGSGIGFGNPD